MRAYLALALLAVAQTASAKPLFKQGTALKPSTDFAPSCTLEHAKAFIGKPGEGNGEAARKAADADSVRLLRPGQMVTMDYREGRLNLKLDDKGVIREVTCG